MVIFLIVIIINPKSSSAIVIQLTKEKRRFRVVVMSNYSAKRVHIKNSFVGCTLFS